jgi:hypothetical protein
MTPRQKRIIGALVIANCVVVLAVVILATRPLSATAPTSPSSSALPSASPGTPTWSAQPQGRATPTSRLPQACQRRAVDLLSRAGLGGTIGLLSDETLQLDLVYPIPQDQGVEQGAQQVWTAFDIAHALILAQCDSFSGITVLIQAQGSQGSLQIRARVDSADLEAYYGGEITESVFIDRVQYQVDGADER